MAVKLNQSGELSSVNKDSHKAVCSYTANFLEAYLIKNEKAISYLTANPADNDYDPALLRVIYFPGKQAPPNEFQFTSIINNQGIDTAVELYRKFKSDYPEHIFFQEGTFNVMGYRNLQTGRVPEALKIFELNADAYPNSANVWDSYGEACLAAGDYRKALENYKKALEILPHDNTTPEALKTAIENGAPQQIQRIEELIKQSESEENQ
jgi:tetratricopeptide (TPR) repeat protein